MTRVIWNLKEESRVFLFVYRWIHGRVWNVSVKHSQSAEKITETGEVFFGNFRLQTAGSACHFCRCGNFAKTTLFFTLLTRIEITHRHLYAERESRDLLTLKAIKNTLTVHAFILTLPGPKYMDTQTLVWSCFSKTMDLSLLLQTQVHRWRPSLTLGDQAHTLHSWWWMWCGRSAKPNWETFIMAQVCAWRHCCSETGRGLSPSCTRLLKILLYAVGK